MGAPRTRLLLAGPLRSRRAHWHSPRHTPRPRLPQDYEIGNGIWPVQRNRTLFVTSVVPVPGASDTFRAWWGAADANVATGILKVTYA